MGIESDHLVYEYLSRVGDLAQRSHLSSGDRMRLVSGLRNEIDRRRAAYEPETPAAVRRILERIGTPEEVVGTLAPPSAGTAWSDPGSGSGAGPRPAPVAPVPAVPTQRGAAPPHLAGLDELGPGEKMEPDWWRVAPGSSLAGSTMPGSSVEGFAGGIEIPELFKDPESDRETDRGADPAAPKDPGAAGAPAGEPEPKRTLLRFLRERRRAKAEAAKAAKAAGDATAPAARPKPHAFLLFAAVALVAGAVSGYWLLLAAGWLLAYASRVLGPAERKWVVFGLPATVFAAAVVWLWGRMNGRWGAELTDEGLGAVFQDMLPWLARAAAVASALYLVWRSRRGVPPS
ncbi:membrane protein [Streptomyces avidinii]